MIARLCSSGLVLLLMGQRSMETLRFLRSHMKTLSMPHHISLWVVDSWVDSRAIHWCSVVQLVVLYEIFTCSRCTVPDSQREAPRTTWRKVRRIPSCDDQHPWQGFDRQCPTKSYWDTCSVWDEFCPGCVDIYYDSKGTNPSPCRKESREALEYDKHFHWCFVHGNCWGLVQYAHRREPYSFVESRSSPSTSLCWTILRTCI